jgi:hypothetical protein
MGRVEVAFSKVPRTKFKSRQQQYLFLEAERGENIVEHPSTSQIDE